MPFSIGRFTVFAHLLRWSCIPVTNATQPLSGKPAIARMSKSPIAATAATGTMSRSRQMTISVATILFTLGVNLRGFFEFISFISLYTRMMTMSVIHMMTSITIPNHGCFISKEPPMLMSPRPAANLSIHWR